MSEYERDQLHRQILRTQGMLTTHSGYNADNQLSWQRSLGNSGSGNNSQNSNPAPRSGTPPERHDCVISRDYTYTGNGELSGIRDSLRGSLVFSHDKSGYLTGRTGQLYDHDLYYYDKAGNLLESEYQGAVMSNRLPGYGGVRYSYNTETRYRYDALGRRVSKTTFGRPADQRNITSRSEYTLYRTCL